MPLTRRKEAPLDPFKRAVSLTTRSIAADSAVEVVFTSDPPACNRARFCRLDTASQQRT